MNEALWVRAILPGLLLMASGICMCVCVGGVVGGVREVHHTAEDEVLVMAVRQRVKRWADEERNRVDVAAALLAGAWLFGLCWWWLR